MQPIFAQPIFLDMRLFRQIVFVKLERIILLCCMT